MQDLKLWWKQLWCGHYPMKTTEEAVAVHRYYAQGASSPIRTLIGTPVLPGDGIWEKSVVSSTKVRVHLRCNLCGWHKSYWRDGPP